MDFYSATISIICIVDNGQIPVDGYTQDIQVHIVKAESFDEAKSQAITLGYLEEHSYENSDGETIFWKFKEIEYIRKLGKDILGVEIATRLEPFLHKKLYHGKTNFSPEKSEPIIDDESIT